MNVLAKIPRFVTSATVTAAVLYLTLAPRPFGGIHVPMFEGADKVVHFLMFFAMAAAYHFDCRRRQKGIDEARLLGWLLVALTAIGAVIEIAQSLMAMGRSGDLTDLLADIVGAFYGLLIAWLLTKKK